jgi:hypothetical protein
MRGPRLGQELIANLVVAFIFAGARGFLSFVHHVDLLSWEVVAPLVDFLFWFCY